jgi:hypothetical protein
MLRYAINSMRSAENDFYRSAADIRPTPLLIDCKLRLLGSSEAEWYFIDKGVVDEMDIQTPSPL